MFIRVKVKPDARREKFEETDVGVFAIAVKEPAERNEANARVRELLARHFRVSEGNVHMVSGVRGVNKTFNVVH